MKLTLISIYLIQKWRFEPKLLRVRLTSTVSFLATDGVSSFLFTMSFTEWLHSFGNPVDLIFGVFAWFWHPSYVYEKDYQFYGRLMAMFFSSVVLCFRVDVVLLGWLVLCAWCCISFLVHFGLRSCLWLLLLLLLLLFAANNRSLN